MTFRRDTFAEGAPGMMVANNVSQVYVLFLFVCFRSVCVPGKMLSGPTLFKDVLQVWKFHSMCFDSYVSSMCSGLTDSIFPGMYSNSEASPVQCFSFTGMVLNLMLSQELLHVEHFPSQSDVFLVCSLSLIVCSYVIWYFLSTSSKYEVSVFQVQSLFRYMFIFFLSMLLMLDALPI